MAQSSSKVSPQSLNEPITLENVTSGRYKKPLTLEDLRDFAKSELSEEHVEYIMEVLAYEEKFEAGVGSEQWANSTRPRNTEQEESVKKIIREFVLPGATKEVNISANQRDNIVRSTCNKKSATDVQPEELNQLAIVTPPKVFEESRVEVFNLIKTDTFPRFIQSTVFENITDGEVLNKRNKAIQFAAIGLVVSFLIIVLEVFGYVATRALRVLVLPFIFLTILEIEQKKRKV